MALDPNEPAVVYIATSWKLTSWADAAGRGYAFKIGTARAADAREITLALGHKGRPNCFGCKDWTINRADIWQQLRREDAEHVESRFKKYLHYLSKPKRADVPWAFPAGSHAESDVFLVAEHELRSFGRSRSISDPMLAQLVRRARWRVIEMRNELHPERDPLEFEEGYETGVDDARDPDRHFDHGDDQDDDDERRFDDDDRTDEDNEDDD